MREIKFRGLCEQSGEFVFGDLVHGVGHKKGNLYILPNAVNLAYVKHCDPLDGVLVKPETVGQFTGLHDKDGREVYEGDIRKDVDCDPACAAVVYRNDLASFVAEDIGGWDVVRPECEAIGNIFENPELLEVANV